MYEYSKMNLSGTDINVKDSAARESAGSAKTEAENASGIATEALTTVREHSVKFATLEATTDAQGVDITTLKSQVGTGTLDTAASSLIPAVNEVNTGLSNVPVDFLGGVSALPSITKDGLFGFSTTATISISGSTLPAGTRCFGVCYLGIAHCIGIANGTQIYTLRYAGGEWSLLATK